MKRGIIINQVYRHCEAVFVCQSNLMYYQKTTTLELRVVVFFNCQFQACLMPMMKITTPKTSPPKDADQVGYQFPLTAE
jgi:hypothetical protein